MGEAVGPTASLTSSVAHESSDRPRRGAMSPRVERWEGIDQAAADLAATSTGTEAMVFRIREAIW